MFPPTLVDSQVSSVRKIIKLKLLSLLKHPASLDFQPQITTLFQNNTIPFQSDHPRHVFNNIIQTTLQRAIRYSSTFEIFNEERRSIKLMLLYNG